MTRLAPALSPTFAPPSVCPFHDGPETLDALLGAIDPSESRLLDALLDLRALIRAGEDAEACLSQALRVRQLLDGRHYLAFYRLRHWLRRVIVAEARCNPTEPWQAFPLPLDCGRIDEVVNGCSAQLLGERLACAGIELRFVFLGSEQAVPMLTELASH